jgi:hypothetical protein
VAHEGGGHWRLHRYLFGTAALLLLFIGIQNAWDAVTYLVYGGGWRRLKSDVVVVFSVVG